jgi:hypothetical protein
VALYRDYNGDYIGVPNDPCLTKILSKVPAFPVSSFDIFSMIGGQWA